MTASVTPIHTATARVALLRVDESTEEHRAEVRVILMWDGEQHVGESAGEPGAGSRSRLVAAATLRAIESVDDFDYRLVDASTTRSGGSDIALVVVTEPDIERALVGTAVIDADNRQVAFARATLDAVNRSLGKS
ncbi:MAG TPA: hypothetical protein VK960_08570 [Acidimicrobiia bacterium]|nr:hypothetical protein [Acidimicrobiia bacterium]